MKHNLRDRFDPELKRGDPIHGIVSSRRETPTNQQTASNTNMNEGIPNHSRRTVIRIVGATALSSSFAGCLGGARDDSSATQSRDERYVEDPPDYDGWFDGVKNYRGTVDGRGQKEMVVRVGAGSSGMSFDPAAVMVSQGTTIVWEWTGEGGTHNVAAESSDFGSEYSNSSDHTYEYTFDDAGVYKYVCEPHRSAGMKGAISVEESD